MKKSRKGLRIFGYVFAGLLIAVGICVFLYPTVNKMLTESKTQSAIDSFQGLKSQAVEQMTEPKDNNENNSNETEVTPDFQQLYSDMQEYNLEIFENGQKDLKDAWSYEQAGFDLLKYGIESGAVGELQIPKIDVDLPLYLGASEVNMANGAAQLGQTSMPIGGNNTNCVIAGHRGYAGAKYFLDIELLEIGDMVYIDNLWETLAYRVDKIEIISPNDIAKVHIQKNRDMVTLITCHPYPNNYQRYVVYCVRDNNEKTEYTTTHSETNVVTESNKKVENSTQLVITLDYALYILVPVIFIILAFFIFRKPRKKKNNDREQ